MTAATRLDKFNTEDFVTSNYASARSLAVLRGFIAMYCLGIVLSSWILSEFPTYYLLYLTNLSFLSITIYFIISSIIGWKYQREITLKSSVKPTNLSPVTRYIVWNLYLTQITFQWIVVIVYWSLLSSKLLANPTPLKIFLNANLHGIGLVFMMVDFLLNRIQLYYSKWTVPVGVGLLYVGYAYIQHHWILAASGNDFWIYPFLDYTKAYWWAYLLGINFAVLLFFGAMVAIHKKRNLHMRGRFEKKGREKYSDVA